MNKSKPQAIEICHNPVFSYLAFLIEKALCLGIVESHTCTRAHAAHCIEKNTIQLPLSRVLLIPFVWELRPLIHSKSQE